MRLMGFDLNKDTEEKGYRIDPVYNIPGAAKAILPPMVRTPEDKSPFVALLPNNNNSWNLETEDFVLKNIDPREGVNFKFGDIWSIASGRGDIFCNRYKNGKTLVGWLGIGYGMESMQVIKIRTLERQIADLQAMLEKSEESRKQTELKYEELQNKINKVKGRGNAPQFVPHGMDEYAQGGEGRGGYEG